MYTNCEMILLNFVSFQFLQLPMFENIKSILDVL